MDHLETLDHLGLAFEMGHTVDVEWRWKDKENEHYFRYLVSRVNSFVDSFVKFSLLKKLSKLLHKGTATNERI